MLAPDYLDHAPDRLVLLWQQVEDDILRDVARRISKMEALTTTANWQLWRYEQTEALRQDVVKKLARYTGKSEAEIRRLMQEAATRAMEAEDEIYYHYGKEPTPFAGNETLQALLNAGYQQTAGTFHNLTATTANTVSGQFEAICFVHLHSHLAGRGPNNSFLFPPLAAGAVVAGHSITPADTCFGKLPAALCNSIYNKALSVDWPGGLCFVRVNYKLYSSVYFLVR